MLLLMIMLCKQVLNLVLWKMCTGLQWCRLGTFGSLHLIRGSWQKYLVLVSWTTLSPNLRQRLHWGRQWETTPISSQEQSWMKTFQVWKIMAELVEDLQKLLDVVVRESELKGLSINCKKTEHMVVSKKRDIPRCSLKVKDQITNQVSAFNYLGSTITEDARCMKEIKKRIVLAKSAFSKLNNILRNTSLSMRTRMWVLNCYVYPVLFYGSITWLITSDMRNCLESCEMWFWDEWWGFLGQTK